MFFNYKQVCNDIYGMYILYEFYSCICAILISFDFKWKRIFEAIVNLIIYEAAVVEIETGISTVPKYLSTSVFVYNFILATRDNWGDIASIFVVLNKLCGDNLRWKR